MPIYAFKRRNTAFLRTRLCDGFAVNPSGPARAAHLPPERPLEPVAPRGTLPRRVSPLRAPLGRKSAAIEITPPESLLLSLFLPLLVGHQTGAKRSSRRLPDFSFPFRSLLFVYPLGIAYRIHSRACRVTGMATSAGAATVPPPDIGVRKKRYTSRSSQKDAGAESIGKQETGPWIYLVAVVCPSLVFIRRLSVVVGRSFLFAQSPLRSAPISGQRVFLFCL